MHRDEHPHQCRPYTTISDARLAKPVRVRMGGACDTLRAIPAASLIDSPINNVDGSVRVATLPCVEEFKICTSPMCRLQSPGYT